MDTVASGTSPAGCQNGAKGIGKNQTNPGQSPTSKGTMREPTQQNATAGDQDLKEALQDLEETKGDWSKGG